MLSSFIGLMDGGVSPLSESFFAPSLVSPVWCWAALRKPDVAGLAELTLPAANAPP